MLLMGESTDSWDPPTPRAFAVRLGAALLAVIAVVGLLGLLLRAPITFVSTAFVARFGLVGVFVTVFIADTLPISTHDPVLFAGHTGGLAFGPLALTAACASIAAAWFVFGVGSLLGARWQWVQRLVDRYRIKAFMKRYGPWAIAVAALLPVPFALVAWSAGMAGSPFRHLVAGSVLRASKIGLTLTLISFGWGLAG